MERKQGTHYDRNRDKKLAYQHKWYRANCYKRERARELAEAFDEPEVIERLDKEREHQLARMRAYNARYFAANRDAYNAKRRAKRLQEKQKGLKNQHKSSEENTQESAQFPQTIV